MTAVGTLANTLKTPDQLIVIHFKESGQRRAQFGSDWRDLSPINVFPARTPKDCLPPFFWQPEYSDEKTRFGFWANLRSHVEVLEQAILAGSQHLLVFEDDARKLACWDEVMPKFYEQLPHDWLFYKLHGWDGQVEAVKASDLSTCSHCRRVIGTGGMQATGYSQRGMAIMYDWLWKNINNLSDVAFGKLSVIYPVYAPIPWTVGHDAESSIVKGTEHYSFTPINR